MQVYRIRQGERVRSPQYPFAVLYEDNWDDFGFKTTFSVEIWLGQNDVASLGEVKVLEQDMEEGRVPLPAEFGALGTSYCSLGQAFTYYETVRDLGPGIYEPYLFAMRDVIFMAQILEEFKAKPGFSTSLTRYGSAVRTLADAPKLFWYGRADTARELMELEFDFNTQVGGSEFNVRFNFGDRKHLPNRINAIIGYNGVGKTTLLANLAMVASADQIERKEENVKRRYGSFGGTNEQLAFGATIAVSYSAFDTFELPGQNAAERLRVERKGELFGYTYCGLRKFDLSDEAAAGVGNTSQRDQLAFKNSAEITDEFFKALKRAQTETRHRILERALKTLALEPSFSRVETGGFFNQDGDFTPVAAELASLSTGHKIVLNIVVQLVAHLQERSLVLIDEPESHLHPPLLAALLRSVSVALEERDSFAVIATHSPVVLQEIPRRYVKVLRRFGNLTQVDSPDSETFGENVGYLTRTVFNLDSSQTDYHRVLDVLARRFSLEQIEGMFDGEMSAQARAYVVGQLRRRA
jgi:predicted ATPase